MSTECRNTSRVVAWLGGVALLGGVAVLGVFASGWWNPAPPSKPPPTIPPVSVPAAVPVPAIRFSNVTGKAGIDFRHFNGMTKHKLLPETMGGGVIVIDFDDDGKPDLLFPNGCPWPGLGKTGERHTPKLYRNKGDGTFEDVTERCGPFDRDGKVACFFGMGGTVGDYNNDGFPDLFLTGIGGNHLYRNEPLKDGGRCLREVTDAAKVSGPGGWPADFTGDFSKDDNPLCFSTSAAFLDYDGDGLLDLFVCNYVGWSPKLDMDVGNRLDGKARAFGQPQKFPGALCFLYRNNGDGTFEDVSASAGVQVLDRQGLDPNSPLLPVGKSLGVIVCDADGDGWPDIIVANDTVRNFFFHNVAENGKRVFKEIGRDIGVAYADGSARGAMGIDFMHLYRPGCNALIITNFADEPNTFLCHDTATDLNFTDRARMEGIAGPSRTPLKFGAVFFDCDLDGRPDFLICNGHLDPGIGEVQGGQEYEQQAQLYWNTGAKARGFELVTESVAGKDLFQKLVGRGCAYLDFNGDGALDVVLVGNGGPALLLRNDTKLGNHWLRLKLKGDGVHANRSAIGAVVTVEAGVLTQRREVASARGYLSQSELVLTFGLGTTTKIDKVTIRWPGRDGGTQEIAGDKLQLDHEQTITQEKR
jgi:hypothetical protein